MIPQLTDPPQGADYKPLAGDLFPTKYPLEERKGEIGYFYRKYYISQRLFFSFPKKAQYCNFEILTHAFNQNIIDLSQANIQMIKTSATKQADFEKFISNQDMQSPY
jgi:hypothetical protein